MFFQDLRDIGHSSFFSHVCFVMGIDLLLCLGRRLLLFVWSSRTDIPSHGTVSNEGQQLVKYIAI